MKIAILTCGLLPIPAVQGGAVENMIDFYLEYNAQKKLHNITIYSPWDAKAIKHPALTSDVNYYVFIDVTSLKARIRRRIYKQFHSHEYYNHFIEYYFEKIYADLQKRHFDYIILENCPGYAYKLSQRGFQNIILHLNNDLLNAKSRYHDVIFNSLVKILTCSNYIRNRVSTIQTCNKIHTLYNAIDVNNFSPQKKFSINRMTIGFSKEDFIISFSGRINKDKGVAELIDAILMLKDEPNIKLMVIGGTFFGNAVDEDDFVRSLKDKAKTISDKIMFTGYIPYDKLPDYLHLADIAVIPSMWNEPFGLTIVEALAAGLPLVTTRSGGIPEICEGVATIVNRENIVNNLSEAILDLYHHPEKRKQMSLASLKRAKFFDKKAFAEKFFDSLENL
jgi:glycosyltransferase involved in cell wall biosynthesis